MTYTIQLPFIHLSKKNETLESWHIYGYWVIGARCQIKKDLDSSPSSPNYSKDYWKLLPLLIYQLVKFGNLMSCGSKDDLVNHGMVKNTNTWISWEWNIIFLWNKKILNLCFRWHILRSYRFAAEVITFK